MGMYQLDALYDSQLISIQDLGRSTALLGTHATATTRRLAWTLVMRNPRVVLPSNATSTYVVSHPVTADAYTSV
jgi:hypothetical protein